MFTTSEVPSSFFNGEAADASLMTVLRGIDSVENRKKAVEYLPDILLLLCDSLGRFDLVMRCFICQSVRSHGSTGAGEANMRSPAEGCNQEWSAFLEEVLHVGALKDV